MRLFSLAGSSSDPRRLDRLLNASIALLVLLLFLKAFLFVGFGQAPLVRDSLTYWRLGEQMAAGDWFQLEDPLAYRPPGFPGFLALCQLLFDGRQILGAAAVLQLAVLATALLAAWASFRLTHGKLGALLALGIALLATSRNAVATYIWSDSLLCLVLSVLLVLLVEWYRRPTHVLALAIGLALGFAALVKPVVQWGWLPTLLVMGLALRSTRGARWLRPLGTHAAALLAGLVLVLAPWYARNQVAFGEPFLVKIHGRAFWWSCFYEEDGLDFTDGEATRQVLEVAPPNPGAKVWVVSARLERSGLSEVEADERMLAAALESMRAQPWKYAGMVLSNLVAYWLMPASVPGWDHSGHGAARENVRTPEKEADLRRTTYLDQPPWHSETLVSLGRALAGLSPLVPRALTCRIAVLASLIGWILMLRDPRRRHVGLALGLLVLYVSASSSIAPFMEYRYQLIVEPLLIVLAVQALHALVQRWRGPAEDQPPPCT